jgi:hypothetical protein
MGGMVADWGVKKVLQDEENLWVAEKFGVQDGRYW